MIVYPQVKYGVLHYSRQHREHDGRTRSTKQSRGTEKEIQEVAGGGDISTGVRVAKSTKFAGEAKIGAVKSACT